MLHYPPGERSPWFCERIIGKKTLESGNQTCQPEALSAFGVAPPDAFHGAHSLFSSFPPHTPSGDVPIPIGPPVFPTMSGVKIEARGAIVQASWQTSLRISNNVLALKFEQASRVSFRRCTARVRFHALLMVMFNFPRLSLTPTTPLREGHTSRAWLASPDSRSSSS